MALFLDTGNPDGLIAMASRPGSPGEMEIEAADDFILSVAQRALLGAHLSACYLLARRSQA